ncbi:uncharacterized protein KY384_003250 [Bacidia gigantensis]|uniref:uncharacterized protein n=1 Tax=Bacidia gigantensis TaxID=2732470 RepID=UPI001D04AB33|nr:uncharacterized protein KY384_003250 [Bacidia gigantensis]KAG8531619.1 hypothetical protein KY384_003250 [Bacidia gigantensis]
MADSKSPSVGKRWEMSINRETEQKNDCFEKEKQKFQEHVENDAIKALSNASYASGSLRSSEPSQIRTSSHRNDGDDLGKQCSEGAMTETGQPAPLPTPPQSPTASKFTILHLDGLDQRNVDRCGNDFNELQATINTLQSKLREKEKECQCLREERRQASRLHRDSIHNDDEEEIEKLKKRVERLDEMLDKNEESIECLQKQLLETKMHKRQLEIQLAEAEKNFQDRNKLLKEMHHTTDALAFTSQEGSISQISLGSERRRQESTIQGTGWAIHCPKGRKKSGFGIARDVIRSNSTLRKP